MRKSAPVFEYGNDGALIGHLNNFLSRATAQFQQSVESPKDAQPEGPDPSEGVWPRAEVRESVKTDSKGHVNTQRYWSLVLHNTSRGPATDVDFEFVDLMPENALFRVHRGEGPLGTISRGQEARFPLLLAVGSVVRRGRLRGHVVRRHGKRSGNEGNGPNPTFLAVGARPSSDFRTDISHRDHPQCTSSDSALVVGAGSLSLEGQSTENK